MFRRLASLLWESVKNVDCFVKGRDVNNSELGLTLRAGPNAG